MPLFPTLPSRVRAGESGVGDLTAGFRPAGAPLTGGQPLRVLVRQPGERDKVPQTKILAQALLTRWIADGERRNALATSAWDKPASSRAVRILSVKLFMARMRTKLQSVCFM